MLVKIPNPEFNRDDVVKFECQRCTYVGAVLGTDLVHMNGCKNPVLCYRIRLHDDQPPFRVDGIEVPARGVMRIGTEKVQVPLYYVKSDQVFRESEAIARLLACGMDLKNITVEEVLDEIRVNLIDKNKEAQIFAGFNLTDRLHYNGEIYQVVPNCCDGCEHYYVRDDGVIRCSWGWNCWGKTLPPKPAHCTVAGDNPPIRFPGEPVWEVPEFCDDDDNCGQTGLCQYGATGCGVPCAALKRVQEVLR